MRITIEIKDEDVKHEVEQQVRKVIAEIGTETIKNVVGDVMRVKLERYNNDVIDGVIAKASQGIVRDHLGADWSLKSKLDTAIRDAAVDIVTTRLKETGKLPQ